MIRITLDIPQSDRRVFRNVAPQCHTLRQTYGQEPAIQNFDAVSVNTIGAEATPEPPGLFALITKNISYN